MEKRLIEVEIYYFKDKKRKKVEPQFMFFDNTDLLFSPFLFHECLSLFEEKNEEKNCIHLVPYTEKKE